jgi:hypothetical protein
MSEATSSSKTLKSKIYDFLSGNRIYLVSAMPIDLAEAKGTNLKALANKAGANPP